MGPILPRAPLMLLVDANYFMCLLHAFLRSLLTACSLDGNGRTCETTCASKVLLQGMEHVFAKRQKHIVPGRMAACMPRTHPVNE